MTGHEGLVFNPAPPTDGEQEDYLTTGFFLSQVSLHNSVRLLIIFFFSYFLADSRFVSKANTAIWVLIISSVMRWCSAFACVSSGCRLIMISDCGRSSFFWGCVCSSRAAVKKICPVPVLALGKPADPHWTPRTWSGCWKKKKKKKWKRKSLKSQRTREIKRQVFKKKKKKKNSSLPPQTH